MSLPPIYVMAAITLAFTALLWGGSLYALSGRQRRFLWLLLPGLPLSALNNLYVKRPLAIWLGEVGDVAPNQGLATPLWFIIALALLPPVTEEAVKVAPLLLRPVRRMMDSQSSALWTGLALGVSFGLGEAAFLAYGVAQSPQYAGYPWYAFTGYLGERLMVSLAHGLLTGLLAAGIWRSRRHAVGAYLAAVSLHLLLNAGAILVQLGLISAAAAGLSLLLALLILVVVLERLRKRALAEQEDKGQVEEVVFFRREKESRDA